MPIQRVPSGFPGPGGTGFWPAAHGDAGGYHHGFFHLTAIWKRPSGVGYALCPVATPNSRQKRIPRYSVSRFASRLITTIGALKLDRLTCARTVLARSATVSRRFWTSARVIARSA